MGRCSNGVITSITTVIASMMISGGFVSKCFYLRSMVILIDITYDDWPIQWSAAYSWVIMDHSGSCGSAVQGYPHWGWEEHLESAAWDVGPWELVDNWLIVGWTMKIQQVPCCRSNYGVPGSTVFPNIGHPNPAKRWVWPWRKHQGQSWSVTGVIRWLQTKKYKINTLW